MAVVVSQVPRVSRIDARLVPVYARPWREAGPVVRWRDRVSPGTFPTYFGYLYRFLRTVGKDPEAAILWAREAPDKYDVLDAIQSYVGKLDGRRYATKESSYAALRSFFVHNRIMLPRDPSFQIRSELPPVQRKLTIENLHELIGLATQPFRSMILVKWMSLLANEGLIYVSNNYAEPIANAVRNKQPTLKLELPGRKRTKNIRGFYTFIGRDALESLREYFERDRGYPQRGEPIWVYGQSKRPVNKVGFVHAWLRLLRRARFIPKEIGGRTTRYGYNAHNTRDLAISLLNTVNGLNPQCIEFFAGHEIDKLGYNQFYNLKPDYVLEQYKLAEPSLNIISNRATQQEKNDQIKNMQQQIDELHLAVRMLEEQSGYKVRVPSTTHNPA